SREREPPWWRSSGRASACSRGRDGRSERRGRPRSPRPRTRRARRSGYGRASAEDRGRDLRRGAWRGGLPGSPGRKEPVGYFPGKAGAPRGDALPGGGKWGRRRSRSMAARPTPAVRASRSVGGSPTEGPRPTPTSSRASAPGVTEETRPVNVTDSRRDQLAGTLKWRKLAVVPRSEDRLSRPP